MCASACVWIKCPHMCVCVSMWAYVWKISGTSFHCTVLIHGLIAKHKPSIHKQWRIVPHCSRWGSLNMSCSRWESQESEEEPKPDRLTSQDEKRGSWSRRSLSLTSTRFRHLEGRDFWWGSKLQASKIYHMKQAWNECTLRSQTEKRLRSEHFLKDETKQYSHSATDTDTTRGSFAKS